MISFIIKKCLHFSDLVADCCVLYINYGVYKNVNAQINDSSVFKTGPEILTLCFRNCRFSFCYIVLTFFNWLFFWFLNNFDLGYVAY